MARRRKRGTGGITERDDGLFIGQVSGGYEAGKRVRLNFSSRDRAKVEFWLRETTRTLRAGEDPADSKRTVGDYLDDWLLAIAPTVKPTTLRGYAIHAKVHISPVIGHVFLTRLRPADIARVRDRVAASKSPRTAQSVLVTLRMALNAAVRDGAIERSPATGVRPPRSTSKPIVAMSADEARAVLAAVDGTWLHPLVVVALGTGLRLGELLGLRWSDIHGTRATINGAIRPVPREDGTGSRLDRVTVKTRTSVRTVELGAMALEALTERRRAQASGVISGYVFTTRDGGWLDPRNVTKAFQKVLEDKGLPRLRWHDLRHGYATLQLANGVPLRVISESLGHSSIGITASVYAHVLPSLQRDAAERLDEVLRG